MVNGVLDRIAHEFRPAEFTAPAARSGMSRKARRPGEFELIARYFAPLATDPAALGLADDAARLTVGARDELVVTTDLIAAGVHFFADDPPEFDRAEGAPGQSVGPRGQGCRAGRLSPGAGASRRLDRGLDREASRAASTPTRRPMASR